LFFRSFRFISLSLFLLAGLQQVVRDAEQSHKRVRAIGSGWSLSNVGYSDDYLINTSRLTHWFVGFRTPTLLTAQFRAKAQRLVFAQCGVLIKTLSAHLEARGLSLATSGASNGQTIAGAISTGTHGAANAFGSIQETVLALHVVAEGGKHYLLQRETRPAVTDEFCAFLGAEPRNDDDLFNAALVSFGSFGVIHAVLFEAAPLYWLERHVKRLDYAAVRDAIGTLDVGSLQLPGGSALPFHFEVLLNPCALGAGESGAFVRALYKRPPRSKLAGPRDWPRAKHKKRRSDLDDRARLRHRTGTRSARLTRRARRSAAGDAAARRHRDAQPAVRRHRARTWLHEH